MRNRWGCISVTGIVAAVAVLLGVVVWTLLSGPVLFSPGALSAATKTRDLGGVASHAGLGNNCEACHTAPWSGQRMAEKCLGCHKDVVAEIQSGTGVHGRLIGAKTSPTCGGCHTDHHGPKGELTVIGRDFKHELTGYSLKSHQRGGVGADIKCAACHPKGYARFDQATCIDCHTKRDAAFMSKHEAAFGANCLACHNGRGGFGDFDHSKFAFRLTGQHKRVACSTCHADTSSLQALKNTPQDCYGCHAKRDKHKGAFGKQCDQCHSTASWQNAQFDHKIFPVNHGEKEKKATCKTCHPKDTTTYDCYGCHAHTPANILARHEGKPLSALSDCIKCHPQGRQGD